MQPLSQPVSQQGLQQPMRFEKSRFIQPHFGWQQSVGQHESRWSVTAANGANASTQAANTVAWTIQAYAICGP